MSYHDEQLRAGRRWMRWSTAADAAGLAEPPRRHVALRLCRHHPGPDPRADDRPARPDVVDADARARLPGAGRRDRRHRHRLRDPRARARRGRRGPARSTSSTCAPSTTAAGVGRRLFAGGPARARPARARPPRGLGPRRQHRRLPLLRRDGRRRSAGAPRTASAASRSPRSASPGPSAASRRSRAGRCSYDESPMAAILLRPRGRPAPGGKRYRRRAADCRRVPPSSIREGRAPRLSRRRHARPPRAASRRLRDWSTATPRGLSPRRSGAAAGAHPPARTSPGATPRRSEKAAVNDGRLAKPTARATACTGRPSRASSSIARTSRISRIRRARAEARLPQAAVVERPLRQPGRPRRPGDGRARRASSRT